MLCNTKLLLKKSKLFCENGHNSWPRFPMGTGSCFISKVMPSINSGAFRRKCWSFQRGTQLPDLGIAMLLRLFVKIRGMSKGIVGTCVEDRCAFKLEVFQQVFARSAEARPVTTLMGNKSTDNKTIGNQCRVINYTMATRVSRLQSPYLQSPNHQILLGRLGSSPKLSDGIPSGIDKAMPV